MKYPESIHIESRQKDCQGLREGGNENCLLNEYGVSIWSSENILELGSGDSWIRRKRTECINDEFYDLCILPQLK